MTLSRRAGTMRPEGLDVVCNDIVVNRRRRVVELGSGMSTVLLARLLARRRPHELWRLTTIEHDIRWVQWVKRQLNREGIGHEVIVVHAPLASHPMAVSGLQWYDDVSVATGLDRALGDDRIDLLLVDGPPAFAPGYGLARYPALPVLRNRLAADASIILDDIEREGEQEVVRRWERETGLRFERLADRAGVAVARLSAPMSVDTAASTARTGVRSDRLSR